METNIAVFKGKEIRKTLHNNEWWFVVEDVVLALIDSKDSKGKKGDVSIFNLRQK